MLSGEGTYFKVPPARDPSSSQPQIIAGRLVAPPDLLTRCWLPLGELSCQFLTLETSLELVFVLEAFTHVNSLSFEILFPSLMIQ